MASLRDDVEHIEAVTGWLAGIIKDANPSTPDEWTAFELMVRAHKTLRYIDFDSLRQLPLDITE